MRGEPLILLLGPRLHSAFVERKPRIGNYEIHVVVDGVAESLTARARTHGIVEAEQPRLRSRQLYAALFAGELLVKRQRGRRWVLRRGFLKDYFATFAIADFGGVDNSLMQVGGDDEAIHQYKNGLREVDIEQRFRRGELEHPAILIEAVETFLAQFKQVVAQGFGGGAAANLKQRVPARTFLLLQHGLRHLVHCVPYHLLAALGTITAAYARVEQPKKVVDFGGSGDGGSRIPRGVFLPNGDGRRDARNFIHIRLFHAFQELPRVGGQRLHVA